MTTAVQSVVEPCNIAVYLHSQKLYLHSISCTSCNKYIYYSILYIFITRYLYESDVNTKTSTCVNDYLCNTLHSQRMSQIFLTAYLSFWWFLHTMKGYFITLRNSNWKWHVIILFWPIDWLTSGQYISENVSAIVVMNNTHVLHYDAVNVIS